MYFTLLARCLSVCYTQAYCGFWATFDELLFHRASTALLYTCPMKAYIPLSGQELGHILWRNKPVNSQEIAAAQSRSVRRCYTSQKRLLGKTPQNTHFQRLMFRPCSFKHAMHGKITHTQFAGRIPTRSPIKATAFLRTRQRIVCHRKRSPNRSVVASSSRGRVCATLLPKKP